MNLGGIVLHLVVLLVELSFVWRLILFFVVHVIQVVKAILPEGVLPQVVNHASIPLRDDALAVNRLSLPQRHHAVVATVVR